MQFYGEETGKEADKLSQSLMYTRLGGQGKVSPAVCPPVRADGSKFDNRMQIIYGFY